MDLPGFSDVPENVEDDQDTFKKKTSSKKGGGFQSMGLSYPVLKGVIKRGYKIPTPIQRKTIPLVLEGRDVVAMARTGSGKTACFLIPMFEKLKIRSAKTGARAIVLSPTRELALQTFKFIKELGRYTGLKAEVILGGDSMDEQFSAIHGNPDIIVATPGRFLHVCVEMDLKLNCVEYIVFDEADRLFEMGFGEQLTDIVNRLPDSRQTLLFSATLPKVLVEFAKAGLSDPVLLRLDVESKLPTELKLHFITARSEQRVAALLVLLKNCIDEKQQTVVFAATKHHVEYLHMVLDRLNISNTYIYSNLDPSARKIHAAKFGQGKVSVLVVTDVAARGIDIPQLDNVINFNFPAKPKLFVHRVGRCARAGRSGTAYSIVGPDEYAYLLDLHLFLGRPLNIASIIADKGNETEGVLGTIPQSLMEEQHSTMLSLHEQFSDLVSMHRVCNNAYMQYSRSRPTASSDSNRRIKEIPINNAGIHSIFRTSNENEMKKEVLLSKMKTYRPPGTIFEICGKNKSQDYIAMKVKRAIHKDIITAYKKKSELTEYENVVNTSATDQSHLATSNEGEIEDAFKEIVVPKKRKLDNLYKKKNKKMKMEKDEYYISYSASDRHTEEGLAVNTFQREASSAQIDLIGDSADAQRMCKQQMKWDRKKKKLIAVNHNSKAGKIRTESGAWIPATYKSNRYSQWKEKTKIDHEDQNDDDCSDNDSKGKKRFKGNQPNTHWARHNRNVEMKNRGSDLKTNEQILKARKLAEKKKAKQKRGKKGGKKNAGQRGKKKY